MATVNRIKLKGDVIAREEITKKKIGKGVSLNEAPIRNGIFEVDLDTGKSYYSKDGAMTPVSAASADTLSRAVNLTMSGDITMTPVSLDGSKDIELVTVFGSTTINVSSVDFNTLTKQGRYLISGDAAKAKNAPPVITGSALAEVLIYGSWVWQRVYRDNSGYTFAQRMSVDSGKNWREWSVFSAVDKATITLTGEVTSPKINFVNGDMTIDTTRRITEISDPQTDFNTIVKTGTYYTLYNPANSTGVNAPPGISAYTFIYVDSFEISTGTRVIQTVVEDKQPYTSAKRVKVGNTWYDWATVSGVI